MKGILQFLDWEKITANLTFTVVSVGPWLKYETKEKLGTKLDVYVSRDDFQYFPKNDGTVFTNLGERLSIRVPGDVTVPIGEAIIPLDPVMTIYGKYNENASVRASGIKVVPSKKP